MASTDGGRYISCRRFLLLVMNRESISREIRDEALLCVVSRLLAEHPATGRKLLEGSGSLDALYEGGPLYVNEIMGVPEMGETMFSGQMLDWGVQEALWMRSKGVRLIHILSEDYPQQLRECGNAPFLLYYRGSVPLAGAGRSLSVVGTRMASAYGKEACQAIIAGLAKLCPDVRIVSGLAIGIDSVSHRAALDNSLQTIAVLPCGLDEIYPLQNRSLAVEIVSAGGIVTEYPRNTKPLRFNFLLRNRIIAALSDALLVAESRIRGGSMITVDYAFSYNRDVFAVPGRMTDANSYGCNYLINKNVAQLCLNASTIVSAMGWTKGHLSDIARQPDLFSVPESLKEKILLSLSPVKGRSEEELAQSTGGDVAGMSLALLHLELEGAVCKKPPGLWYRNKDNEVY